MLFVYFLIFGACFGQLTPWKPSTALTPNFYNFSTLSQDDTNDLRDWIVWKNKMPRYTFLLDKVFLYFCLILKLSDKTFQPDKSSYKEGIGSVGLLFMVLAFYGFFFFIFVTSCRVFKNRCGADYTRLNITQSVKLLPIILLILWTLFYAVGCIIAAYGNIHV